jgi:DNA-binding NarL/FixJ family response regulator
MMNKIKIAIADDQHLFRKAIVTILSGMEEFDLIIDAENGRVFMDKLKSSEQPDIALIDLDMPEINGMELQKLLHSQYPEVKTIMLTVFNQEAFIGKMIEAGANGYLAKNCDISELVTAIVSVYKTGFYFNADCVKALRNFSFNKKKKLTNNNNIHFDLTERELEILDLICKEFTNNEIADQLFLSVRTIEGHRNNLLAKVGCRNIAGLVIFAIKNGLYKPWLR